MKNGAKIKVFLADDHPMILAGVRLTLSKSEKIEVVGDASVGTDVIPGLKNAKADVMLMDLSMPVLGGAQILRRIKHHAPDVRVIAFTVHDEKEYIQEIIRLGASGYLLKDAQPEELIRAIESVYAGNIFFSACVQRVLMGQTPDHPVKTHVAAEGVLAQKEEEVLALVAQGLPNLKIAEKLYISDRTVETYRRRITDKLNIHTVAGLTKYAIEHGLLDPS